MTEDAIRQLQKQLEFYQSFLRDMQQVASRKNWYPLSYYLQDFKDSVRELDQ